MKDQINTIRAALFKWGWATEQEFSAAIKALSELEAMAGSQEPVAWVDPVFLSEVQADGGAMFVTLLKEEAQGLVSLYRAAPPAQQYEAGDMASAAAQGFRDGVASVAQPLLNEAIDRINDMLKDDDGQAYKEARKFVDRVAQQPQVMVDMVPPATARDRWMYEQGRLAERDPRTHADLCERICAAIKAADDKSVGEAGYMLDSNDCIRIVREQFADRVAAPHQPQAETDDSIAADAYVIACKEMERWQQERRKAGKAAGTTGSLVDGIAWLYGYINDLEAQQPQAEPRKADVARTCPFCNEEWVEQPQARPDFTDEWAGYLKDGETPFERFLRERKDMQSVLKLYQRVLEENERLKAQQPQPTTPQATTVEDAARDVGKWLNERPNRELDLRSVAMLVAHAQQAQPSDDAILQERDEAEDFIDALLDEVLGADRPEWSSAYGRAEALAEVQERMAALEKPMVDRAWQRFEQAQTEAVPNTLQKAEAHLLNLIGEYWGLAYAEGAEGRTHDTEDGAAQRTHAAIAKAVKDLIAASSTPQQAEAVPVMSIWLDERGHLQMTNIREIHLTVGESLYLYEGPAPVAKPYRELSDEFFKAGGRVRVDPVTGDVGFGTPGKQAEAVPPEWVQISEWKWDNEQGHWLGKLIAAQGAKT